MNDLPTINLIQDGPTLHFSMSLLEITHNPLDKMVFEHTLNQLVKEVWGDEFIDVCMGEMFGEWLRGGG